MNKMNRSESSRALAKTVAYLECGKPAEAETWAVSLMHGLGFSHLLKEVESPNLDERSYNGWANRETWATALHIDNNFGSCEALEVCAEYKDSLREAAEALEEFTREIFGLDGVDPSSYMSDLLEGAFARVDFREIAASIIDELHGEDGEENA